MSIDNELKSNWQKFAQKTKGKFDYDENVYPGGDQFKCQIRYDLSNFSIHFVAYKHRTATASAFHTKVYTKVFVPLDKEIELRFSMFPENIATKILKVVGLQDINIGVEELDKKFVFKGTNENGVRNIFTNKRISKLLLTDYGYNLKIKQGKKLMETELPDNKDFLFFDTDELIYDIDLLENLLALFKEVMSEIQIENKNVVQH